MTGRLNNLFESMSGEFTAFKWYKRNENKDRKANVVLRSVLKCKVTVSLARLVTTRLCDYPFDTTVFP